MLKTNDLSDIHAKKKNLRKWKKKVSDLVRLGLRFSSPTQGASPYRQRNKSNSKNRENEDGIVLETEKRMGFLNLYIIWLLIHLLHYGVQYRLGMGAQWIKCLPCKSEEFRLNPWNLCEAAAAATAAHICNASAPVVRWAGVERESLDLLAKHTQK